MSRYDHPSYRSSSAPARTASQPTTEDRAGADAGTDPGAPSLLSTIAAIVLAVIGVLLIAGVVR